MSESDLQQRLDETLSELERLRAENERLRTMLALAQGTQTIINAGNGDVRPQPTRSGSDSSSSAAAKVALIRRLFRGRDDVYPLLEDDSCWFLACDFDDGTWQLDALALLEACAEREVPAALERSRSG